MRKEEILASLEKMVNLSVDLNDHWSDDGHYDIDNMIKHDKVFYRGILTGLVLTNQITLSEQTEISIRIMTALQYCLHVKLEGINHE